MRVKGHALRSTRNVLGGRKDSNFRCQCGARPRKSDYACKDQRGIFIDWHRAHKATVLAARRKRETNRARLMMR